jgi:integrase
MPNAIPEASSSQQHMNARELSVPLESFATHLASLGHTPLTVSGYLAGARHFGEWLHRAGLSPVQIDDGVVSRFASHRCSCPGGREHHGVSGKYVIRVRRFVAFLADEGIVTAPAASCDRDKPCGIRDRAILLLLARLGLRAGDILDLTLDDID